VKAALLRQVLLRQKVPGYSAAQASEPSGGKRGLENDSDGAGMQPLSNKSKANGE